MHYSSPPIMANITTTTTTTTTRTEAQKPDPIRIQWRIRKVLGEPDVALDRMFKFTRAEAEHVLAGIGSDGAERARDGQAVRVKMVDADTGTWHELSFKKVKRGSVFGFKLGWVSHFVARRRLRLGDEVGMYVDPNTNVFHFCVLSRANN